MHKKFEIEQTKIKGGCQSGRKVVTHNSKSDLLLAHVLMFMKKVYKKLVATLCPPWAASATWRHRPLVPPSAKKKCSWTLPGQM